MVKISKDLQIEGTVVNLGSLITYSETPQAIGFWSSGKPIYRKMYYFGALGSNTITKAPLNLEASKIRIINIYGAARNKSDGTTFPVTTARKDSLSLGFGCFVTNDNYLNVENGADRTNYDAYVFIEYINF